MPMRKVIPEFAGAGEVDLDHACRVAVRAAEAAGAVVRRGLVGGRPATRVKDGAGDVVAELDLAAERLVVRRIRAAFPGHGILAEEHGLRAAADGTWSWLVEPLDGTNNVAIGLRACAVGIALCRNGVPVLGVVHDPVAGHTYWAIRDRGAFGPDGPLHTASSRLADTGGVLAWLQGYAVGRDDARARALRLVLERGSRRLVQLWAPLLCWVMLARGDIEGFVGYRAGVADLPAGGLIAREAGVRICGFDGVELDGRRQLAGDVDFVAGSAAAVEELVLLVKSAAEVRVAGFTA
jgi:myo-inositol-1(or 4)-monophosphatase